MCLRIQLFTENSVCRRDDFSSFVRFEVFMIVTMKNAVFYDVPPCGSCYNRRFGGRIASIIRVEMISELGTLAVASSRHLLILLFLAFFHPDDGGDTFLRNVGCNKTHTSSHHRIRHSSLVSSLLYPLCRRSVLISAKIYLMFYELFDFL
jgi:hypothetical protein